MPVDFSSPEGISTAPNDGSMFAPTPLWDRDARKRRGRRAAAGRPVRDPAIDAGEPAEAAYETQSAVAPEVAPERVSTRRRGHAGAIAAGVAAVAAVAAIGWYASRPHDAGVIEMTPSATSASQTALNTATPSPNATPSATPLAATPAPTAASTTRETTTQTTRRASAPVVAHRTHATVATRAPAPRVRPAGSNSAMDAGVNAAAAAPTIAPPAATPGQTTPGPTMEPTMNSVPVAPAAPMTTMPSVTAPSTPAPAANPTVTP